MAKSPKIRKGLTVKQDAVVKEVVRQVKETGDVNLTQIGLKVFNTTNPKSASQMTADTLDIPGVQQRIEKALATNGMSLEQTVGEIAKIAKTEDVKISGDVKLRSLEALLRIQGIGVHKDNGKNGPSIQAKVINLNFNQAKEIFSKTNEEGQEFMVDGELL